MKVKFTSKGDFAKTEKFLRAMQRQDMFSSLDRYARQGVAALAAATPVDSGVTANQWTYEIEKSRTSVTISWINTHTVSGIPLVIMLTYGHGTGTGGYVQGRDFINPAIQPIMDQIANEVWSRVQRA